MQEGRKDVIEVITKIVTAASALIAGIAIPVVLNYNEAKNRQSQLYVQIMSQREQSDSALRERMFNELMRSYFGSVSTEPERQIMYLHLLTLNFQEFFDAKPLFEDLDKKLTGKSKKKLQGIAREVADRQVNMLTKEKQPPAELLLCSEQQPDCETTAGFSLAGPQRTYSFNVELLDVGASEVSVRVSPLANKKNGPQGFDFKPMEIDVSYYDTPFMNNTRMADGTRFAIVLKNSDPDSKRAVLKIVPFPQEFMSLRDRPYFDEMLARVREDKRRILPD